MREIYRKIKDVKTEALTTNILQKKINKFFAELSN